MNKTRIENDTLGKVEVPLDAYYGAQTQRAYNLYKVSGIKPSPIYTFSTTIIKKAAVVVNLKLKLLEKRKAEAIIKACNEICSGKLTDQFLVDPFQAGAGTSHNMNVNEVIANRANEILGAALGSYKFIHPNDDVNMSQSTNDVIPTAIRITALILLSKLFPQITRLIESFNRKSDKFAKVIKSGRTHLQDALPITLGQEFAAYAAALKKDKKRIVKSMKNLFFIGIGATAIGTGINTPPQYSKEMVTQLQKFTGLNLIISQNLVESTQNTADFLELSGSLRTLSQTLIKIGNDLRFLTSGPKTGLNEINLPTVQPGSSIMPGKINPSIVEMLTMICFQIIGLDLAILMSSQAGQLELNVMTPLIANNLFTQIQLLTNGISIFNQKCVKGITANIDKCNFWFQNSSGVAAVLNPYIGYEKAAELVKESLRLNISIKKLAVRKKYLTETEAVKIFSPENLTKPNILVRSKINKHVRPT